MARLRQEAAQQPLQPSPCPSAATRPRSAGGQESPPSQDARDTEAGGVVSVPGRDSATTRRPEALRRVDPSTAPLHPRRAIAGLPCGPVGRSTRISLVPAVLGPLPNVAESIVQSKRIRIVRTDRRGSEVAVRAWGRPPPRVGCERHGVSPVCVLALLGWSLSPIARRHASRPCHVLPLRFAQQPVLVSGLVRQPADVGLRLVPVDIDHRAASATPPLMVGDQSAASTGASARVPLVECHFVDAHSKRRPNRYVALRTGVKTSRDGFLVDTDLDRLRARVRE